MFLGANTPECESSREWKFPGHFAPGSESSREREGQRAKGPCSEWTKERKFQRKGAKRHGCLPVWHPKTPITSNPSSRNYEANILAHIRYLVSAVSEVAQKFSRYVTGNFSFWIITRRHMVITNRKFTEVKNRSTCTFTFVFKSKISNKRQVSHHTRKNRRATVLSSSILVTCLLTYESWGNSLWWERFVKVVGFKTV